MNGTRCDTGSTWLSAYLFTNASIYAPEYDRIVLDIVQPFVRQCQRECSINGHFFIRYSERGPHLRLRLRGDHAILDDSVWPALRKHLQRHCPDVTFELSAGGRPNKDQASLSRVHGVIRQAYEPELDRYGGTYAISVAERMFEVSSEAAFGLLSQINPWKRPERLGKALLTMVVQMHAFIASPRAAAAFSRSYGQGYLRLLAPDSDQVVTWMDTFAHGFDQQSGQLTKRVERFWQQMDTEHSLGDVLDHFRKRVGELRDELRDLCLSKRVRCNGAAADPWGTTVGAIVPSYIHLMNNRLGITPHEESYLAYLIARTLRSGVARVRP